MTIRRAVSALFIFQLIVGPISMAHAASGCGISSGSDPFLYEVVRQSYVYSTMQERGRQGGKPVDCGPMNEIQALFVSAGGGMAGCQAIANCTLITRYKGVIAERRWAAGHSGEDHCFRGPEVPNWEQTVCADIDRKIMEGTLPCPDGHRCRQSRTTQPGGQRIVVPSGQGPGEQPPPSTAQRGEHTAPPPPGAGGNPGGGTPGGGTPGGGTPGGGTPGGGTPGGGRQQIVYQTVPAASDSVSIDNKWLWGLGGLALGVGAGYLIWGNQYKTQYVPYYQNQQQPQWQNLSNAWGQVPGRYNPYGAAGAFGQIGGAYGGGYPGGYRPYMGYGQGGGLFGMPTGGSGMPGGIPGMGLGGGAGYGLGGNYQLRQPPVMLPPVWN